METLRNKKTIFLKISLFSFFSFFYILGFVFSININTYFNLEDENLNVKYEIYDLKNLSQNIVLEKDGGKIIKKIYGDGNKEIDFNVNSNFIEIEVNNQEKIFVELEFKNFEEIKKKKHISTFLNVKNEVSNFDIFFSANENYEITILDLSPRRYFIIGKNNFEWKFENVNFEINLFIPFKVLNEKIQEETSSVANNILLFLSIPLILFSFFIIYIFIANKRSKKLNKRKELKERTLEKKIKKDIKKKILQKAKSKIQKENNQEKQYKKTTNEKNNVKEKLNKYLTENEKSVVKVIMKNDGISQNEILNYLPNLTKSNLSKIITKLHSKRFLNRIRVGKVTKIYLGDEVEKGN